VIELCQTWAPPDAALGADAKRPRSATRGRHSQGCLNPYDSAGTTGGAGGIVPARIARREPKRTI
jgi:hypothetical protein